MEKLNCHVRVTTPAVDETLEAMKEKINELVSEVNELKIQLSRVRKDRPDPRNMNPYDLNRYPRKKH